MVYANQSTKKWLQNNQNKELDINAKQSHNDPHLYALKHCRVCVTRSFVSLKAAVSSDRVQHCSARYQKKSANICKYRSNVP